METNQMMRYEANKKSVGVAYLLWFFFGMLGVHRFYLHRGGSGTVILLLTLGSFFLMFIGIGLFLIFIPGIWVFIDIFLIPGMARDYNNKLVDSLVRY